MPMNRRHLVALGGTAVAVAAAAVLLAPRTPDAPTPSESPLAFPNLAPQLANARRIEVRQGNATLTVVRGANDVWTLPQKGGYPARGDRVRELLTGLTELRLTERRTADPDSLSRLGLDTPGSPNSTAALLRVLDGNNSPVAALIVGRRRMRTQGGVPESVYVRRPEENQSWLGEGRLPVDADPQLWIDREVANLPHERVRRVISVRDGHTTELLRDGDLDAPLTIALPGDAPPADDIALDEVGRALEALSLLDVRREAEMPGDAAGESRFFLTDGLVINARVRTSGNDVWVRLTAEGSDEAARLNARWNGWAYQVGSWKAKAFAPSLDDLRRREDPPRPNAPEAPATQPSAAGAAAPSN
ncbi:DUF4340 domain-containing protein [Muricoccus radiodurans]|uniref:DUF4340 domain-containing protein n=1 Tax=Muricoccus radiodurans TaxID=2231721 RepID=UPI003CF7E96F